MKLPFGQDGLILSIVDANPNTVVVLEGTIVEIGPWLEKVPALLEAWYPGMEGGNALARVLFGDVNPSGKLPATFPRKLEDSPAHALGNYPGTNGTVTYAEGLLVGYRWFITKDIRPQFPFGYGLSYTTFEYSDLKLVPGESGVTAEFDLKNTGSVAGAEVAQLYVHPGAPSVARSAIELKGFKKIFLKPGESAHISIPLDKKSFAFYDPAQKCWVAEKGGYQIQVGRASRKIVLTADYTLPETAQFKD
jgi:beta-glucosidase